MRNQPRNVQRATIYILIKGVSLSEGEFTIINPGRCTRG